MSTPGLFINSATVLGNEYDPDLSNNTSTIETAIHERISEFACIIVPKIFSACQSRECFPQFEVELPCADLSLVTLRFGRGQLSNQTITPLINRPNFARVTFDVMIPMFIVLKKPDGTTLSLSEKLPTLHYDIVLYYPKTASEINFTLDVETRSELLSQPIIIGRSLVMSVGVFLKIFVVMPVQLRVEAFGYCPEPEFCEEYNEQDVCKEFFSRPWIQVEGIS